MNDTAHNADGNISAGMGRPMGLENDMYTRFAKVTPKGPLARHGAFPVDMLRYDRCCPCREVDSARIMATFDGGAHLPGDGDRGVVVTKLTARKTEPAWTVARWASFGWELREITCSWA